MLFSDDYRGAFGALAALAVVVFAGVGFSLLVDRRFEFSSGANRAKKDIRTNAEWLEELEIRHLARSKKLESLENPGDHELHRELVESSEELGAAISGLKALSEELAREVAETDGQYAAYRANYRKIVWAAAAGEKLGNLRIRGGREYRNAVVRLVTPVGLEIHHDDGLARIQAPDLDDSYQDRFQWNAEERHMALERERKNREQLAGRPEGREEESASRPSPRRKPAPPSAAELETLRLMVRTLQAKTDILRGQTQEASYQISRGRVSVPGSLETWQARSRRLNVAYHKANAELGLARSRLAAVSPRDPLLRNDP